MRYLLRRACAHPLLRAFRVRRTPAMIEKYHFLFEIDILNIFSSYTALETSREKRDGADQKLVGFRSKRPEYCSKSCF